MSLLSFLVMHFSVNNKYIIGLKETTLIIGINKNQCNQLRLLIFKQVKQYTESILTNEQALHFF